MNEIFSISLHDSYIAKLEIENLICTELEIKEAYRYTYLNEEKFKINEYCKVEIFDIRIIFNNIKNFKISFLCDGNEFLVSNCDFFINGNRYERIDLGTYKNSSISLIMMNFDKIEIHSEEMHLEKLNF